MTKDKLQTLCVAGLECLLTKYFTQCSDAREKLIDGQDKIIEVIREFESRGVNFPYHKLND